ncbi:hypothetical protein ABZ016_31645 [Streptomyces sp. NPDC006372]|uniref:hypothetical protein n=1 Tax=Streptomyces sp. NPDC006372 TaxID=3155599 RepID=UPI0033BAE90E
MTTARHGSGLLTAEPADGWQDYEKAVGPDAARQDAEAFHAGVHRAGWTHIFPPPLFSLSFADELANAARSVMDLLYSIPQRVFGGDVAAWMSFQGIPEEDAALLLRTHSERAVVTAHQFARPDFLLTEEGLRIVEVNVSAPMGGMMTHDPYVRQFRTSGYHRFLRRLGYETTAPDMTAIWGKAFRSLVRQAPVERRPVVFEAIADENDMNTGRRAFEELVGSFGFDCVSGMVQDLDIRDDGVFHQGRHIDVVFTMYTWLETRRFVPPETTIALSDADAAGLVDFVGPPTAALYNSKSNLEILTSPAFSGYFTAAEREFVDVYLPRTFRLTDETLAEALSGQSELVLKPASEYGGRGIVFGPSVSRGEWTQAVTAAAYGAGHVCQQLLARPWRCPGVDATGRRRDYHVCLGPLVFGSEYAGTLVRWADTESGNRVINVKQGAEAGGLLTASPARR